MTHPIVFISYSHDSDEHKQWVLKLATDLRTNGVDATLDQWDLSPGQDMAMFMQQGITNSDRVLMICSDSYVKKSESGNGGVGYERLIVTSEVIQSIDTRKFVPLIKNGPKGRSPVPNFLGPRLYIDFSDDKSYDQNFERLLRDIHNAGIPDKPALGTNPFSGRPTQAAPTLRATSPTGRTPTGQSILDDDWFNSERNFALKGLEKINAKGSMELRFASHETISKSQIDLLDAVQQSNITTFGWPIGVVIRNGSEYSPTPTKDGVKAEISIERDPITSRESYDYWKIRNNGDFYLAQNLFEDQRSENEIYFNTRIIRVTESIMFSCNLYKLLGLPEGSRVSMRITHQGLTNRKLAAVGNRFITPWHISKEDESESEITGTILEMENNTSDFVERICTPLFTMFDFMKFEKKVYEDIVTRFKRGETS